MLPNYSVEIWRSTVQKMEVRWNVKAHVEIMLSNAIEHCTSSGVWPRCAIGVSPKVQITLAKCWHFSHLLQILASSASCGRNWPVFEKMQTKYTVPISTMMFVFLNILSLRSNSRVRIGRCGLPPLKTFGLIWSQMGYLLARVFTLMLILLITLRRHHGPCTKALCPPPRWYQVVCSNPQPPWVMLPILPCTSSHTFSQSQVTIIFHLLTPMRRGKVEEQGKHSQPCLIYGVGICP